MSEEQQAQEEVQQATPYELIGGEGKVFALVDRFYDLMDETPEYYGIRKLHPATLDGSRAKLKMYLSGWLGGPQLYVEKFGHPRLRARHLPFSIGADERNQWLACMYSAMEHEGMSQELQAHLREAFFGVADWMRNREG
ncbi:MAG TPA: group II truncated hemoglobin [Burkholderiales bacterium]|jgi:hemoglobin